MNKIDNEKAAKGLTEKFLNDFMGLYHPLDRSFALHYTLPEILAQVYPHSEDEKFYSPYIGMGFLNNMIRQFFNARIQGINECLEWIINNYPRDYHAERYRLQNWIEGEINLIDEIYNSKWEVVGHKNVSAKFVNFEIYVPSSGLKSSVICDYFHYEGYENKIRSIKICDSTNKIAIVLNVDLDGVVKGDTIVGTQFIPIVNATLNALQFIYQNKEEYV